jgi:hypothetical protein
MKDHTDRNRALLNFIVLPTLLLSAGLLGGLRIDGQTRQFIFIAPPLVTLLLAILHRTADDDKRLASADSDCTFLRFSPGI